MRKAQVYNNSTLAGILIEKDDRSFEFIYDDFYFLDSTKPAISLTISKSIKTHTSKYLFPFFFSMLSEGFNKQQQCKQLRIDENDHFGLLLKTASDEYIGAIRVVELLDNEKIK